MTDQELKAELEKMSGQLDKATNDEEVAQLTKEVELLKRKVELVCSTDTFEAAAEAIRESEGCSRTVALEKARLVHADLFKRYQDRGSISSRPIFKGLEKKKAVQDFELLVEGIRQGDKVPRHVAMERARRLHPESYQAYQDA